MLMGDRRSSVRRHRAVLHGPLGARGARGSRMKRPCGAGAGCAVGVFRRLSGGAVLDLGGNAVRWSDVPGVRNVKGEDAGVLGNRSMSLNWERPLIRRLTDSSSALARG